MKAAASIADIARMAAVSTATVDRVLNRRPGVRPATIQRVLKAATRLEYLLEANAYTENKPKPMRLVFLLPAGTNRVIRMFCDAVDYSLEQLAPFNVKCRCETTEEFNPQALATSLLRLRGRADGVAFMALDHPLVREAVKTLASTGIPIVTLISDLSASERSAYVGLDNVAAGRTAGYLLGRITGANSGKLAMVPGSLSYRTHIDREFGFSQIVEEMFPAKQVIGLREGKDDPEKNYRLTRVLLEQYPDLVGIYNIGGASDGVARALKEAGRDQKIVFVGHGLTPDTRALLIDGTMDAVITQDPQTSIMSCVRILTSLRDGRDDMTCVKAVNSIVIFRENLP